jgi:AcrR family transcriptional regulator
MRSEPDRGIREVLLDSAERLLGRYGYRKTTVDDVAREAGVGKGTVYLYFESKEELILGTIDRIVDRLIERLRGLARSDAPPRRKLGDMLAERVLFRFDSVRDYSASLDELLGSLRNAYLARRSRYFEAEAAVFAEVIRDGLDRGTFACSDPLAVADSLLTATNSLLPSNLTARELGKREDVRERVGRVADLLLNGLLARVPGGLGPG